MSNPSGVALSSGRVHSILDRVELDKGELDSLLVWAVHSCTSLLPEFKVHEVILLFVHNTCQRLTRGAKFIATANLTHCLTSLLSGCMGHVVEGGPAEHARNESSK